MKTKEIREYIKAKGFERGAVYVLEAMNEELQQTRRDLRELATYFDKIVDMTTGMVQVAGEMKRVLDAGKEPAEEDLGPNTHALGRKEDE